MFDPDDLPAEIVPALTAFAQRLTQHIRAHRDAALEAHEQGLLDAWRASAPALLEGTLHASTTGLDPTRRPLRARCPACATPRPFWDVRGRTQQTRLGPIGWRRPWYYCRACRGGWSPTDQTLEIGASERTSAGVRRWAAELGAAHTFAEAQALLADLTGVQVGEETLRTHAQQVGTQLEAAQQAQIAHVQTEHEPLPGTGEPVAGQLLVETDGVMVRYRHTGWHEVKLGLVAGCRLGNGRPADDPTHCPPVLVQPSYVAARESAAQFGPRLLAEAARRGALDVVGWEQPPGTDPRLAGPSGPALAVLRRVQVLGDGAVWIWHLAVDHFGAARLEVVDWFHASEHLWHLAKALHGEGTPETTAWAEHALGRLWEAGSAPLLTVLRETTAPTVEGAEALRVERGYFTTNAARMDYPASARSACRSAPARSRAAPSTSSSTAWAAPACAGASQAPPPSSPCARIG
jgi:hypothetical protein